MSWNDIHLVHNGCAWVEVGEILDNMGVKWVGVTYIFDKMGVHGLGLYTSWGHNGLSP